MTTFDRNAIIIRQICNKVEPGKTMLQKLMYLIDRRGADLGLNYSIHYFGPYSSKLDETIHVLESYDKLVIDTSGSTHIIHIGNVPIEGELTEEDQDNINFVMEHFSNKSAFDLEAITTLDYVADKMFDDTGNEEEIIHSVKRIKGNKFSDICLKEDLQLLKHFNYV